MNCLFCSRKLISFSCQSCAKENRLRAVWMDRWRIEFEVDPQIFIGKKKIQWGVLACYVVDQRSLDQKIFDVAAIDLTPQNAREHCERILKLAAFS